MTQKDALNALALALLDTLGTAGIPESYVHIAAEQAGVTDRSQAVAHLIGCGMLSREPGPRLVPGPDFGRLKLFADVARGKAPHIPDSIGA